MQQSRALASKHMSEGGSLYAASEMFVLMDFLHVWAALNNTESTSLIKEARAVFASKPFSECSKPFPVCKVQKVHK